MKINLKQTISGICCAAFLASCSTQQQQHGKYTEKTPVVTNSPVAPAPMPMPGSSIGYFPSGKLEGSGLSIEKSAPSEVLAGVPFQYTYKVSNLTDATLENVMVHDRVSSGFSEGDSNPKASSTSGGVGTWKLGNLGPKESKTITVNGSSADEGVVTTCGWATYNPVVCEDIKVVKANIKLTKTEPADVVICDPIPVTLAVQNTGSSPLSGVQISDNLPSGMTSDGKSSLTYDAGTLAPGETKEFKYNAMASSTGKLVNKAEATCTQGVKADATASTTVHQPVLTITCKAPDQQFMGRKFDVCYTVSNKGDAPSSGSTLMVTVPPGLSVVNAGANGQAQNGGINYTFDSLAAGATQTVCATFMSAAAGDFNFTGSAKGSCAAPVSTTCSTHVVGVPAILLEKSDDPDPVAIGDTTTYTVKVTNQGTADDHNVQVTVTIASELMPVSSSEGTISGQTVTLPVVPTLSSKQAVTYKIIAKGVKAGDGHTVFKLTSDVLTSSISAEESTHVY